MALFLFLRVQGRGHVFWLGVLFCCSALLISNSGSIPSKKSQGKARNTETTKNRTGSRPSSSSKPNKSAVIWFADAPENDDDDRVNGTEKPIHITGEGAEEFENATSKTKGRFFGLFDIFDFGKKSKEKRAEMTRYLLRLKEGNNTAYHSLKRDGSDAASKLVKNGEVKVIIHGFTHGAKNNAEGKIRGQKMFEMAEEYGRSNRTDLNIIVMDWTQLSTHPTHDYPKAADGTRYAGKDLARFLIKLKDLGLIALDKVHLLGYSLGSHVAGVAGYQVGKMTHSKFKLGRITGLDPAGPLFVIGEWLIPDKRKVLDESDAGFVDILHCDMGDIQFGKLGSKVQAGHTDFYPNGGVDQPGCFLKPPPCSHAKCPEYFMQSINLKGKFPACPCSFPLPLHWGKCTCEEGSNADGVEMGEHVDTKKARGRYYVKGD